MSIHCPYCGVRPIEEFSMRGDATTMRPGTSDPANMDMKLEAEWHDYVYLRYNPKGKFEEYWHHAGGCRVWLVVTRNTITHEIYSVVTASEHSISKQRAHAVDLQMAKDVPTKEGPSS